MRNRRFIVALTGGLASGKSLALKALRRAGAATVALDEIAHEVARPGTAVFRRIVAAFGRGVLARKGGLDRRELARRVFADPAARSRIERITHPAIRREMWRRVGRARGVVVVDVPLLFEKGKDSLAGRFDATLLISTTRRLQIRRATARGMTKAQARERMAAQLPDAVKAALADVVVRNTGTRKDFERLITEYYKAFELIRRAEVDP
ncbi:MAG: dephospho-CoA kinase [Elusimicrobia bacterium]|nr:dephospho-CoA kinase [Elusimicrobiota bacterium]